MATKKIIESVWKKAKPIRGKNPNVWRKDIYGNIIRFSSYGTKGDFGWEIDHIKPKDKGGSDQLINFRPLHWTENRKKGAKMKYKGK